MSTLTELMFGTGWARHHLNVRHPGALQAAREVPRVFTINNYTQA
jgi:hypothetical protein